MRFSLTAISAFFLVACAGQDVFKDEFDNEKPWVEQQAQLPPYPSPENLISFDVGPNTSNQHFVDTTSIDIGEDDVIRYSLVVKSSTGAMNVSFEGIRCETFERKLYALGRDDGTWSQPRISEWGRLDFVRQLYAQRELAKNLFCPHKQIVSSPEEAIRALKAGMHPQIFR